MNIFNKLNIFRHLKLEIALAIPEWFNPYSAGIYFRIWRLYV